MPSSSAAIMLIAMREPATSIRPSRIVTVPSGAMVSEAGGLAAAVEPEAEGDAAAPTGRQAANGNDRWS